ncbi:DpnII family type II restriction endonuclease [Streptococcus sp. SC1]|uniref:DpnII family type II restriction endonuclease n=1 Tax=Streptococcus TaxID=1301 RepID=UPI002559F8A6|nr:DpnII family type II restriction endonuclease [Streptococcus sp. SC1]MDL2433293.1 DpnII family type II restriction endonuclease [Streptococcus sp. SC1]
MADVVRKIEFEELFNSTTMFYVNDKYEEEMEKEVQAKVDELAGELQFIHSKEDLKQYIIDHKDALDNLTSLMEISTERFKRMVSMIRKDRGFVFSTEWGLGKIRTAMMDSPAMMESVLDLLYDGRNDERMKAKIPFFYLDNMGITEATLAKLQNKDSIRLFVKRGLEGKYSNNIGDLILEDIERKINQVCVKHGLDYEKNVRVPILDRAVSFVLESPTDPKIIIDVSYSVTTSSAQGDKKNAARKTEDTLKKEREKGNQIIYVNFLDGAGWIGRQADMREIHRCSDYVINFNNLNLIEDIITSYVENHM